MKVKFDGIKYVKKGRNGTALKDLCFNIFKKYLGENSSISYEKLKNIFNEWHCNNRKVLLTKSEWLNQTDDGKSRYFNPIHHDKMELYFTTQWGNNGGDCDNINNVIEFAKGEKYDIEVLEWKDSPLNNFYGLWTPRNNQKKIDECLKSGIWYRGDGNFNKEEEARKIASMSVGDKIFLYDTSEDIKLSDSPFSQYLPQEYLTLGYTVVKAKCVGIGKVVSTNIEDLSVTVDWNGNYQGSEWYLYTRQDGVWWFDGKTQNKYKAQKLYDIVFNGKEQDYRWWAENGGFNVELISEQKINENNQIKNIILYGSPGVGKTHNTNKLISLIESGKSEKEIFETIKNNEKNTGVNIDDLKDRVKFVTFHQSFGYEDFIEGFRPNEEGNIQLEKGIFLEICKDAEENLLKSATQTEIPFSDAFKTLFKEKVENEESVRIDLKRADSFFKVNDFNDKTIYFEKQSGTTKHTLSIDSLEKMYSIEKNDFINGGLAVYYEPILDKLLEIKRVSRVEKVERKNYYLVIDEINRGNISKIFGELITLIEEDKRDTFEVTLPYSKKSFKIPSNLYIIGTMNSTDKSIALIDIALRRRFTFLKMEPKIDLVKNDKAKNIMRQLNEKITQTLGADYVLGHSYFMKIENDDDLEFVLEYKIRPLLEEYFYGDSEGLKQILEMINE